MQTYRHDNPTDRSDVIYLRPAANAAHIIWLNRWHIRRNGTGDLRDASKLAAFDEICARLVAFVEADVAETEMVSGEIAGMRAEFDAAKRIMAEHDRLDPQPEPELTYDESTTCRHGVAFDTDCPDCEI